MGREIRRVPLDFDIAPWQTWPGYLMPEELHLPPCPDCVYEQPQGLFSRAFGLTAQPTGLSPEAFAISNTFYEHQINSPIAAHLAWADKIGQKEVDYLIEKGRLRVWRDGAWQQEPRTAAEINETQRRGGLNGHDSLNRMFLVEFRCQQLGIVMECATCGGAAEVGTDEQRAAHEAWEPTEPPAGPGYQLWQTVSEGGPVSPVFETPEELADWIINEGKELDGSHTPRDKLIAWIGKKNAWAPSMMSNSETGILPGIQAMAERVDEEA